MTRCKDETMFYRPPVLEEPCAQTLSGITPPVKGCSDNLWNGRVNMGTAIGQRKYKKSICPPYGHSKQVDTTMRRAEVSWNHKCGDEMTWDEKSWHELSLNEMSWEEMRTVEMRREEVRRVEMRGEKISTVRHAQQKWEEKMRTDEKELRCGAEMKRTVSEMKTADRRRGQLRWTEKRWENMRWGHMKFVFNCTCIDAAVKASYVTSWRGSVGWNHGDGVNRWTNSMLWWRCVFVAVCYTRTFFKKRPTRSWCYVTKIFL